MAVVTPTDRPKSVHNRCVIEGFGGVFVLSIGFRIFCWYKGFNHRTESDLLVSLLGINNLTHLYRICTFPSYFCILLSL